MSAAGAAAGGPPPPIVAVRMICRNAEPTTTNKKKPSSIGPIDVACLSLTALCVALVPRLVMWPSNFSVDFLILRIDEPG